MSVMKLTMIVHSEVGNEDGYQDACMQILDLPDNMDRETAIELMSRLSTHIDDELKAIDEEEGRSVWPSTKGQGWPK